MMTNAAILMHTTCSIPDSRHSIIILMHKYIHVDVYRYSCRWNKHESTRTSSYNTRNDAGIVIEWRGKINTQITKKNMVQLVKTYIAWENLKSYSQLYQFSMAGPKFLLLVLNRTQIYHSYLFKCDHFNNPYIYNNILAKTTWSV